MSRLKHSNTMSSSTTLICELVGVQRDPQFQRCRLILQELSVLFPHVILPKLHGGTEHAYLDRLRELNDVIPRDTQRQRQQQHPDPFVVVNQRVFLGNEDELVDFALEKTRLSRAELLVAVAFGATTVSSSTSGVTAPTTDAEAALQARAEAAAQEALFRYRQMSGNQFAYLLFEVDGVTLPRVEIELFQRECPRTVANFVAFCESRVPDVDLDDAEDSQRMLGYKGSRVHRIVAGGWLQAGDVLGDGDGPVRSLYGGAFPDEGYAVPFDSVGVVAMTRRAAPHTNGSQFFITLAPQPWLQRKQVAFGRVVSGLTTIQKLGQLETLHERPCVPCTIVDAGRITE
ncbi:hypothetical protein PINS_up008148 [Pythium insidiosum]|nr:hypothetical protein PINS_up008148 [Pythium insidiosum]